MFRGLPHALVYLGLDVPMELKHRMCDAFSNLNECDLSDLFMALIRKMWPSFADMQSDECIAFLQAWPAHKLLVTKVVEYAHRSNKSVSRPEGPGKTVKCEDDGERKLPQQNRGASLRSC